MVRYASQAIPRRRKAGMIRQMSASDGVKGMANETIGSPKDSGAVPPDARFET